MSLRLLANRRLWFPGVALAALTSCAAAKNAPASADVTRVQHVDTIQAPLVGARCDGQRTCRCRPAGSQDLETPPPTEGTKRLELRLSAADGEATLSSPTMGSFQASGAQDTCFYIDVVSGSTNEWTYTANAANKTTGFLPRFSLSEYGQSGPYWYDIVAAECRGETGRCDRAGAEQWMTTASRRKRGRIDPCGSTVVSGLHWDTTGGQADRDGGLYRDFTVNFILEVKKFRTQFPPNSTECIPKDRQPTTPPSP